MNKILISLLALSLIATVCKKPDNAPTAMTDMRYVNIEGGLNVRATADKAGALVKTLPNGTQVNVLAENSESITIGNKTGGC